MKVFHRAGAGKKRIAVGVLATSMLAAVLGLAPAAHAVAENVGCNAGDLRSAVNAANVALSADSISLQAGCTYTFSSPVFGTDAALVVTDDLTIYGYGAKIVIAKGANARHFDVTNGAILTLNNVTLSGGNIKTSPTTLDTVAGSIFVGTGAALVGDKLTVKDNEVTAIDINTVALAGGIRNGGILILTRSTVKDNEVAAFGATFAEGLGGGIYTIGRAVLTDSSVKGNEVTANATQTAEGVGGGILNSGILTIDSSSISGNDVSVGAGFEAFDEGGGLLNNGSATILKSTVSGNKASAAGAAATSAGGGIANLKALTVDTPTTESDDASSVKDNKATCSSSFCAALGGGTYSSGPAEYFFTLFKGNVASAKKGGAAGGGLAVVGATTTLHEATVTKNTATGKVAVGGGVARFKGGAVVIDASDIFKNKPDNCFNVLGC